MPCPHRTDNINKLPYIQKLLFLQKEAPQYFTTEKDCLPFHLSLPLSLTSPSLPSLLQIVSFLLQTKKVRLLYISCSKDIGHCCNEIRDNTQSCYCCTILSPVQSTSKLPHSLLSPLLRSPLIIMNVDDLS